MIDVPRGFAEKLAKKRSTQPLCLLLSRPVRHRKRREEIKAGSLLPIHGLPGVSPTIGVSLPASSHYILPSSRPTGRWKLLTSPEKSLPAGGIVKKKKGRRGSSWTQLS